MFVSTMVWRFKPGASERVAGVIRERILPTTRNVRGLRHLYAAPVEGDAWLSVLIYDSPADAEHGLQALTPVAREAFGDSLIGSERHAGDATIEERFG